MPDIPQGNQVFDLIFHPKEDLVYTALLTGEIRSYAYNDAGEADKKWDLRPTKKPCRGIALSADGGIIWSVSKGKSIHTIDTAQGSVIKEQLDAHESPINRVAFLMENLFVSGDDDGVIKLWDPRTTPDAIRSYTYHNDFISDFEWLGDKKHLVATSGDGTLSVLDIRSNKTEPFAQSEDQEDELLSVLAVKGGKKLVVGTQLGVLSIFDRAKGYADSVDRFPGHPHSVDALAPIFSGTGAFTGSSASDVIATGSSDGIIRLVQIHPNKFLGAIADHGEFPVERVRVDRKGKWLGSASHDELLKLTDLEGCLEDSDDEEMTEEPVQVQGLSSSEEDSEGSPESDSEPGEQPKKRKKRNKERKDRKTKKQKRDVADAINFYSEL